MLADSSIICTQPTGSVADYDWYFDRFVTVFCCEGCFGFCYECLVEFSLDEVDCAASEATSHDTGTCYAALLGYRGKEIELFA